MTKIAIPHIAKIYTQTLLLLAEDKDKIDKNTGILKIGKELQILKHMLDETPELLSILNNPSLLLKDRQSFLVKSMKACKISDIVIHWLLIIVRNNRINIIREIIIEFENQVLEKKGEQIIDIELSAKIEKDQRQKIIDMCNKELSAKLIFRWHQKPNLLSGIRIVIGHKVRDISLAGDLIRLRRVINFTG